MTHTWADLRDDWRIHDVLQASDFNTVTGRVNEHSSAISDAEDAIDALEAAIAAQGNIMSYRGSWNASTNSPSLSNGSGDAGDVYIVGTAGSRNFGAGSITFAVGDYVIYSGTVWQKLPFNDLVVSVAGLTGSISASSLKTALSLVKGDVGLGNVDNTSDATKWAASAAITNKDLTSGTNTFPTFNQSTTGSAATLTTARTVRTNLASTSTASFNGSADITPGVTGTLPVANGGTGVATLTGLVKASGTSAFAAAVAGTDYVAPGGALGTPSSGTLTNCTGLPNAGLVNSAVTIAGTPTSLGGSITQDAITGLSTTGLVKRSAANTLAVATAGTDYVAPGGALGTPSSGTLTNCTFPTLNQNTTGSAATLTTARAFQTNLASTSSANFDGSAANTHGVTGTLPVGNGGSGATTLTGLLVGNGTSAFTAVTAPSGAVVGTTDTQSLTNKTIDAPALTGTTKIAQSGALEVHNQADQATNYEKGLIRWNNNVLEVGALFGGNRTARSLRLGVSVNADNNALGRTILIQSGAPFYQFVAATGNTGKLTNFALDASASSSTQSLVAITSTVAQTSTAGYNALHIDITESTTGSGQGNLINAQVGGTSKFRVDNTGAVTAAGPITSGGVALATISGAQAISNKTVDTTNTLNLRDDRLSICANGAPTQIVKFDVSQMWAGTSSVVLPMNASYVTKLWGGSGSAPSTSSSAGVAGQVEWDSSYMYVCTATNTWKRAALSTW